MPDDIGHGRRRRRRRLKIDGIIVAEFDEVRVLGTPVRFNECLTASGSGIVIEKITAVIPSLSAV
jgi:hypothetical protein